MFNRLYTKAKVFLGFEQKKRGKVPFDTTDLFDWLNADVPRPQKTPVITAPNNASSPTDEETTVLVGLIPKGPWGRQTPTVEGGYALPSWNSRWKPTDPVVQRPSTDMSAEECEATIRDLLTPKLVASNTRMVPNPSYSRAEPPLLYHGDKRQLSSEWMDWCCREHSIMGHQAWAIGSVRMIDSEFNGKMRENVEILPWDCSDPHLVKIKYHDPGAIS